MKRLIGISYIIYAISAASLFATTASTTLTLVEGEGNYGQIDVTVSPEAVSAPSTDTSTLTGSMGIQLEIDTDNDTVSQLTVVDSNIVGTQVSFAANAFVLNYNATSSETIGVDVSTTAPPGSVDPLTGNYNASDHPFLINEGTLTGYADIIFQPRSYININFAETPFGSANSGTGGNIALTLQSSTSSSKTYSVVMIYPVVTNDAFVVGTQTVNVAISGVVKAVGTIVVPLPSPFQLWLDANGLTGAGFDEDSNLDGVANGLQWALGLTAIDPPGPHLLKFVSHTPSATTYTVDLPIGGSAAPITILSTSDLGTAFSPLASEIVDAGNPIPQGTAGTVTITLPPADQGFLTLSATE